MFQNQVPDRESIDWSTQIMGNTFRRFLLVQSILLMFFVVIFATIRTYTGVTVHADEMEPSPTPASTPEATSSISPIELGDTYLRIAKTSDVSLHVEASDVYAAPELTVDIQGMPDKPFSEESIERIYKEEHYFGKPQGAKSDDPMAKAALTYEYDLNNFTYIAHYRLTMNHYYVPRVLEDEAYIYIALDHPGTVYEKIVVIDAGHGGNDTGTYSSDLTEVESTYTLSVAKHLKNLFADNNHIRAYFTRLEDEEISLEDRTKFANELEADYFVSIHLNGSDSDTQNSFGMEALYYNHDDLDSKTFAQTCLTQMIASSERVNRGVQKRKDLYVLKHTDMPSVILELGFMCNDSDMRFIKKKSSRKKIATGIYNGILQTFGE